MKKNLNKLKVLFVLALLGLNMNTTWARNYALSHSTADSTTIQIIDCPSDANKFNVIRDGTQLQYDYDALGDITSSGQGAVNIEFYTTRTVLMNGNIIASGNYARLYLQKKVLTEAELPTLKRNSATGNLMEATSKGMFYIYGYDNTRGGHFIIDSGAVYPEPYDARVKKSEIVTRKAGRIIRADRNLTLQYVTLQNAYHDADFGGAAIGCRNGSGPSGTAYTIDVRDAVIRGMWSRSGPVIILYEPDYHLIYFKNVQMYYNHGTPEVDDIRATGIIRSWGSSCGAITLDSCNIHHNLADVGGGAIYWNASGRGTESKCYVTGHTQIHHNEALEFGGAIVAKSNVEIDTADIYNNVAPVGGGIHSTPYTGGQYEYSGQGTLLNLGGAVTIHDNEATEMGGGVYYAIYKSNDVGFTPGGTAISPEYRLDIVEGAEIYHNTAPKGAGIAVDDYAPFRHLNNRDGEAAEGKWSLEIRRSVNITGGSVHDNYCTEDVDGVQGAGFYIWKHKESSLGYTWAQAKGAGTMNVNIYGGLIKDNVARNNNRNGVGGGFYIENTKYTTANYTSYCPVTIGDPEGVGEGVTIEGNTSDGNGAGIYIATGDLTVYGGHVGTEAKPNIAYNGNGAGVYLADGNITINGGNVDYNQAKNDPEYGGGNGGAFYLEGGIASIRGGNVAYNKADVSGGGFYIESDATAVDTIKMGASIHDNEAVNGGGLYIASGSLLVQDAATTVKANYASNHGGGVYVAGGTYTMTGGVLGGTTAEGNYTGSVGMGGGLYMQGGTATLSGCSISGNSAPNGYGGGIYMEGGDCTLSGGAIIGGTPDTENNLSYANSARFGGGLSSAGGDIMVMGGEISYNKATLAGGGIYSDGPEASVTITKEGSTLSYLQNNEAVNGGGIFANRGTVDFIDGNVRYNSASEAGGGMYVNTEGNLVLKGSAILTQNRVPEGHNGGGVYLLGTVTVGEQKDNPEELGIIKVQDNFAGDEYIYTWTNTGHPATDSIDQVTANNRNNIYLPEPRVRTDHRDVITVIENGISLDSRVGFSVPSNYVPVIYCAPSSTSHSYLDQFSTGHEYQYMVFDDTRHYVAVHYSDKPTVFDPNHVYLYGFWSNIVTGDEHDPECPINPDTFDPMDISTPCELAFFISYVNGLNSNDAHPSANAKLTADIDMSKYGWVPIGHLTEGYKGTFDGNGHTVTGISSLLYREYLGYGFFGTLNGATVKDLFVKDAVFAIEDKDGIIIGGLAAEATGNAVVENCEVQATIIGDNINTIMGGLIGRTGEVKQVTSSDWMESGNVVPVNGNAADKFQKTEFIIPASELEGLDGADLKSMQFFVSSTASGSWSANFDIFLKEVESTTLTSFTGTSGATTVYSGVLSAAETSMKVNFDTPYSYGGGNLLVGIYETIPGTAYAASFYGVEATGAAIHGESASALADITSGTVVSFRPKTMFNAASQEIATSDGTVLNETVPINGAAVKGYFQKTEYIIPASELTGLAGGTLGELEVYLTATMGSWGTAQRFQVFLKEVDESTVTTSFYGPDDATVVFTGRLNCNDTPEITVPFSTPFEYHGGNLLVGFYQTAKGANNRATTFFGVSAEGATVHGQNSSKLANITSGDIIDFRPKTVFRTQEMVNHQVISDGAITNRNIPVCGRYANRYQKNEFVIPAADLADMSGSDINSVKFYLSTPASGSWGNAEFQVFLKEVSSTTVTAFSGADDATVVFEGKLDASGSTMTIQFTDSYHYNGGNLLVGIYETTTGSAKEALFAGIEINEAGIHGESASGLNAITSGTVQNFRPKTVFGYVPVSAATPNIHSTISIADMTGYLMGGLVGQIVKGKLGNSFTNTKFNYKGTTQYVGGLVGINAGTVENCYVRLRDVESNDNFGWFAGSNNGTVQYSYAPAGITLFKARGNDPTGHGNYAETHLPYLYQHRDTQVELVADEENDYVPSEFDADRQMLVVLNNWVDQLNDDQDVIEYTRWGRPWQANDTLKPINDDLPILKMPMCEAVGSDNEDPYLYYNTVDTLMVKYTAADGAIWLYRNPADIVRGDNTESDAKLYIAEDVALINVNELNAYVGITLDNSAGTNGAHPTYGSLIGITTDATDWHMISTPLLDAPLGIEYTDNTTWEFDLNYGHPSGMPYYRFYLESDTLHGYFPSHRYNKDYPTTNTSIEDGSYYQEWDFYSYDEPQYHWINFKRNSASHFHFDTQNHDPLTYTNEKYLTPGKGYFAATREETFLQCQGTLNSGDVDYDLTQTPGVPRHGYNLLGNPYQAYLDFNIFAEMNSDDADEEAIWTDPSMASYTILDEDARSYVTFAYDASNNPPAAGRFIHPHQGFFVLLSDRNEAKAYFLPAMRNASDTVTSTFRGNNHIDYPLVNLFVSEADGSSDMVTVELGRPEQGGAPLMQGLRAGHGKIWCHYNDEDYAVAYTQPGITEAAIRFETVENTEYTITWSTYNGEFSYMHLIDNLTGADVDCLSASEYRFSASTSDYKSRFRLVFDYTSIDEDVETEASPNFAFMMNDELVVTGEGTLQVFDMTGRMLISQELHGVQTAVTLPNAANGVYVLRLTEGSQSRVQKMVISK